MSGRWFRFYDNSIHDTKVLRLSDATFRAWMTLLCIASRNDGLLPAAADIAVELRCKPALVAGWIAELTAAVLLDKTDAGYVPHNWAERQYKSDSSAERMKRHRDKKRDAPSDVTVTVQNRTETDTETEHIDSVANATGADAPIDHRKRLFDDGLSKLAAMTGKGPDACRSFVGKCLKAASDDAIVVLGLIEDAERNRVVDPGAWIMARIKPPTGPPTSAKPLTEFQQKQRETNDVRAQLRAIGGSGERGGTSDRVLSLDHGERSEGLRGGPGSTVLALPGAPDRRGH